MASILRQKQGTQADVGTTHWNALANGTAALGLEYDNSASDKLWPMAIFELNVTFGSAPAVGQIIDIYTMVPTNGTDYGTTNSLTTPSEASPLRVGQVVVGATTNAQRLHCIIRLPPTKFKLLLYNRSGQAFPATGTTAFILPFTTEVAAS